MKPEIFKPIPGFDLYVVGDRGTIISYHGRKPRFLRVRQDSKKKGYYYADLWQDRKRYVKSVAQLVLLAHVGPPGPGQTDSRHLDGNPSNNDVTNLAWGTHSENEMDKLAYGRDNRGEKHYGHKLTEKEVKYIRDMLKRTGLSQYDIADIFGVSQGTIEDIKMRRIWAWLK